MGRLTIEQMADLDKLLRSQRRALVELDTETRWSRWEHHSDASGQAQRRHVTLAPPHPRAGVLDHGYLLVHAARVKTPTDREGVQYVTDVNDRHSWRRVWTDDDGDMRWYPTLADAARGHAITV